MITIINENLKVERKIIGEINFGNDYLNEINVEDKNKFPQFKKSFSGKYTIEVYGNEGTSVPHFHIEASNKSFSCCICIFDNRFFTHGKHKDILARKDWKTLDDWMRSKNSKYENNTKIKNNWDAIVFMWKQLNGDIHNEINEQPDYTTIKPYKER